MAYSTLQRKTPLKAKTTLKSKSTLKASRSLSDSYSNKIRTGLKKRSTVRQKAYVPKYKYESIFTDDLTRCVITGSTKDSGAVIHVHHIFGASNKTNSEKYHFLIPLRADWHDMADYGIHFNKELDLKFKRMCQDYYLKHYGTKEQFISEFRKWW
jgi:hypothetical protein